MSSPSITASSTIKSGAIALIPAFPTARFRDVLERSRATVARSRETIARSGSRRKNPSNRSRVNGVFFPTFTSARSSYQTCSVGRPFGKNSRFVFTPAPAAVNTPPGKLTTAHRSQSFSSWPLSGGKLSRSWGDTRAADGTGAPAWCHISERVAKPSRVRLTHERRPVARPSGREARLPS